MQKCDRKVPDTSPQARKNTYLCNKFRFFKENIENIGEKNREKKYKIIIFAKTLKNEGFGAEGAEIFLGIGQNFRRNKPPPCFATLENKGGVCCSD